MGGLNGGTGDWEWSPITYQERAALFKLLDYLYKGVPAVSPPSTTWIVGTVGPAQPAGLPAPSIDTGGSLQPNSEHLLHAFDFKNSEVSFHPVDVVQPSA